MHEFEIIRRFFSGKITLQKDHVVIGPGDDCAVVRVPNNFELCLSTDTFIEGVHFPFQAKPALIASRLSAANLSDLAAMGAEPFGFTLAISSPEFTEHWLEEFSDQLEDDVEKYQNPLLGGNLSRGPLSLTMNIMGIVPTGTAILRSNAKVGDDIYVSGNLGDAAGGLALMEQIADQAVKNSSLLERYSSPVPRVDLGQALRKIATAAIDISDGFAADLGHLCEASGFGAQINLEALPLSTELVRTFGLEVARVKAIRGGDDYELCFTAEPDQASSIQQLSECLKLKLTKVGKISHDKSVSIKDKLGSPFDEIEGYQHF
ncbi:MAG: thiamine-phosphate kinase [Pseudomonadales bacterium]|nr:thiamine-phosphate kinase [Pseudomonadales bacterium]